MATLSGSTIASTYDRLLALPSGGLQGATLGALTDGNAGATSCLSLTDNATGKAVLSIDGSHANGTALYIDNSAGDGDVSVEWQLSGTTTWLMGIEDGDSDSLKICHDSTMGTDERLSFLTASTVVNEDSADIDFRVEGNGDANLLFCDAGNDRVGIGTAAPNYGLHVSSTANTSIGISDSDYASHGSTWYFNNNGGLFQLLSADQDFGSGTHRISVDAGGNVGIGTAAPASRLQLAGNISAAAWGVTGIAFDSKAATYTDTSTSASATVATAVVNSFAAPTLASTNSMTVTDAFTMYVPKPVAGSNTTITRANSAYFEGNVGIGTAAPATILHISEVADSTIVTIACHSDTNSHSGLIRMKKSDNTEASPHIVVDNEPMGTIQFCGWDGDDAYQIGAEIIGITNGTPADGVMPANLQFWTNTGGTSTTLNAYVHEGGDFYTNDGSVSSISSDERLKKDIRDFTHGLSVVNQLNPVYYKFNGKGGRNEDVADRIGMLANVVKDIAPDIVKTYTGDLDGVETELWTMSYDKLIFYAINAIQELSAKVTALENA